MHSSTIADLALGYLYTLDLWKGVRFLPFHRDPYIAGNDQRSESAAEDILDGLVDWPFGSINQYWYRNRSPEAAVDIGISISISIILVVGVIFTAAACWGRVIDIRLDYRVIHDLIWGGVRYRAICSILAECSCLADRACVCQRCELVAAYFPSNFIIIIIIVVVASIR
jgi:hypothetical protein